MKLSNWLSLSQLIIGILTLAVSALGLSYFQPYLQQLLPQSIQVIPPVESSITETTPNTRATLAQSLSFTKKLKDRADNDLDDSPSANTDAMALIPNKGVRPGDYSYIDGYVHNALFDGDGILLRGIFEGKNYRFHGTFKDNREFDYGTLEVFGENAYTYTGSFQFNKPYGHGTLRYSNIATFAGTFSDGLPLDGALIKQGIKQTIKNGKIVDDSAVRSPIRFSNSP